MTHLCTGCGRPIMGAVHMGLTAPGYHAPFHDFECFKTYMAACPFEGDRNPDYTEQDCIDEENEWKR